MKQSLMNFYELVKNVKVHETLSWTFMNKLWTE